MYTQPHTPIRLYFFIIEQKDNIRKFILEIINYPLSITQQASTLVNEAISLFAFTTAFIQT